MQINNRLKKYKFALWMFKHLRKLKYTFFPYFNYILVFNTRKYLRLLHLMKYNPYEKMKELKDKHKGERCFIIATGPSLKINDLEKLKNEVTFSMNSIVLAFEETNWRPTYYGIQDRTVYKNLQSHIEGLDVNCKFFADTIPLEKDSANTYIFPLNLLNHLFEHKKYKSKFTDNPTAVVYDGYSITYSLIQIAVYMGFKEIYLLGADCNYSRDMNHHFKEYGKVDPLFSLAGDKMISAYKVAKKYADEHNIKILNATRGGMLEVFERVDIDKLLTKI